MIELPEKPAPNGATPVLMDFGVTQRPPTGGAIQKVVRSGGRFKIGFTYPPMGSEVARKFIARLLRAKRKGRLRVKYPLLDTKQPDMGQPVMNGANQSGESIVVSGFRPLVVIREGFWFSITDAQGRPYLHNVTVATTASATGAATIQIEPPLRHPFANGAVLDFEPYVEGFIDGEEWSWTIDVARIYGIAFTLEEFA